jgi:anti-sigma regulatory factor (Ser/Thr protein kinase)
MSLEMWSYNAGCLPQVAECEVAISSNGRPVEVETFSSGGVLPPRSERVITVTSPAENVTTRFASLDQSDPRSAADRTAPETTDIVRRFPGYKRCMATARFGPDLQSAAEARRFVHDELQPAGAGEDTIFRAQLLATELVTNAARHAHSAVDLTVAGGQGRVRIEARDDSTATPTPPTVETPTRHRGLLLIEDLSEGWGVDATHDGKVVWCELASKGLAR